jgi:phosphatidylinositol glycan class N
LNTSDLQELLSQAEANKTLNVQLRSSRIIFFCHFLGIDTNGHAHRPNSDDYLNNIVLVDKLVEKVYNLLEDFYERDGKTSFIVTADHGMSNKGAHGDGDPANTRTPLVAWGAGIEGPAHRSSSESKGFQIDLPTQSKEQVMAQINAQKDQEEAARR